jgi:hypothetical protein
MYSQPAMIAKQSISQDIPFQTKAFATRRQPLIFPSAWDGEEALMDGSI